MIKKIAVRIYMASMGFEGMWALRLRRRLIATIICQRSEVFNVFANVFIEGFKGLRVGNHVSINRDFKTQLFWRG